MKKEDQNFNNDLMIKIQQVGARNRTEQNLKLRLLKTMEEIGEAAEAYLSVNSQANGKNKTLDDLQEELVDCLIMAVDTALTSQTVKIGENSDYPITDIPEAIATMSQMAGTLARGNIQTNQAQTDYAFKQLVAAASWAALSVCGSWDLVDSIAHVKLEKWKNQLEKGIDLISCPKVIQTDQTESFDSSFKL